MALLNQEYSRNNFRLRFLEPLLRGVDESALPHARRDGLRRYLELWLGCVVPNIAERSVPSGEMLPEELEAAVDLHRLVCAALRIRSVLPRSVLEDEEGELYGANDSMMWLFIVNGKRDDYRRTGTLDIPSRIAPKYGEFLGKLAAYAEAVRYADPELWLKALLLRDWVRRAYPALYDSDQGEWKLAPGILSRIHAMDAGRIIRLTESNEPRVFFELAGARMYDPDDPGAGESEGDE